MGNKFTPFSRPVSLSFGFIYNVHFYISTRVYKETFSRTATVHQGILSGLAISGDSVSPRLNTIAPRDLF